MKPLPTPAAEIYFKGFDYFISQVKQQHVVAGPKMLVDYPIKMHSGDLFQGYFMQKVSKLEHKDELDYKKQIYRAVSQINLVKTESYQQMVENAVVDSVNEYGFPTMLVNIETRTWMLCNPEDFRVLVFGDYSHIVCQAPQKNKIYRIEK